MRRSRFRTTAVSLALLAVLAAVAYFSGAFSPPAAPQPHPSDHSPASRTELPSSPGNPASSSEPPGTRPNLTISERKNASGEDAPTPANASIGFASLQKLQQHYQKHGSEFGSISMDDYLRRARALRDRPAGGNVLECVRPDGVTTRYDRSDGAFLAFNPDRTIRTFFRPNDGESYFRRQCERGTR